MCDIPTGVENEENVVRAIIYPFHLNSANTKLRTAAFRSPPGKDEVSVIRQTYMGSDFCKVKGREIAARKTDARYVGLAVLRAGKVRQSGSEVYDSRQVYCGHAHISHGIVAPPDEPLPPEKILALDCKLERILAEATYHRDPDPQSDTWTGPPL